MKTIFFTPVFIVCATIIFSLNSCDSITQQMLDDSYSIGYNDLRYNSVDHYIFNSTTGEILYENIDWIFEDGDSIGIVAIDDKRAYVNFNNGEALTAFEYDKAWTFSNNRGVMVKAGNVYIFRRDGSLVNSTAIKYANDYSLVYHQNMLIIQNQDGKVGVLDTVAQWILPQEYNSVDINFEHKLFVTRKDDVRSVISYDNKTVLLGYYSNISVLWEDGIIVTELNGIDRLYSYDGKLKYEIVYDYIERLNYLDENDEYHPTNCYVYRAYNGKCGLMNRQYKILTPPLFYEIDAKTEHIFFAKFSYNTFGTLIDENGRQLK